MEIFSNVASRAIAESWYPKAFLIRPVRGGYRVFLTAEAHEKWWKNGGESDL